MSIQDLLLARAGRRTKAKRNAALAERRRVVAQASRPDLSGVIFASGQAKALAEREGLSWQDFEGVKFNGCNGYILGDVRKIIAGRD